MSISRKFCDYWNNSKVKNVVQCAFTLFSLWSAQHNSNKSHCNLYPFYHTVCHLSFKQRNEHKYFEWNFVNGMAREWGEQVKYNIEMRKQIKFIKVLASKFQWKKIYQINYIEWEVSKLVSINQRMWNSFQSNFLFSNCLDAKNKILLLQFVIIK